ncbi:CHAT domain-containing tetratricopeptide repeat protein [Occultella gossypii]|uniref:CHAT domain-containing protein n=1 Tax=Occultella gossypii TaxID=2800820 RepID=A0ABS7SFE2_9MICO|nr:CHAT domain-containing protein [Occultella gossypii]MBZ2198860.1 CHAT domain-containing protein [Occultella gossypii]
MRISDTIRRQIHTGIELQMAGRWKEAERTLRSVERPIRALPAGSERTHLELALLEARATLHMYRREWAAAEERLREMLRQIPAEPEESLKQWQGSALTNLSSVCAQSGRDVEAAELSQRAVDVFESMTAPRPEDVEMLATTRNNLAAQAARESRFDEAKMHANHALVAATGQGSMMPEGQALRLLGTIASLEDDLDGAADYLGRAQDVLTRLGAHLESAQVGLVLARLAAQRGDGPQFAAHMEEVREAFRSRGELRAIAEIDYMQAEFMLAWVPEEHDRAALNLDWTGVDANTDPYTLSQDHQNDLLLGGAVDYAIPAALALDAMRTQFPSGYQRERFVTQVADPARDAAFRAALQSSNGMAVFALIEWQAASGTPTVVLPPAAAARPVEGAGASADEAVELMLPSGPAVAVKPVPRMLLAPGQGEVLGEEYATARTRYGQELRSPELLQRWAEPGDRPTVVLTYVDTGHGTFCNWRIDGAPGGVGRMEHEEMERVLSRLAQGLPSVAAGVDKVASYTDLLTSGPLVDYDAEWELAVGLARVFLATQLVDQLAAYHEAGVRAHVRVQPSPRTAAVPWELLAVDTTDVRLVEIADVTVVAPGHGPGSGNDAADGGARSVWSGGGRFRGRDRSGATASGASATDARPARGGLFGRLRRSGAGGAVPASAGAVPASSGADRAVVAPPGAAGAAEWAAPEVPATSSPADTVMALDPRIPGWPAASALGSVLGRVTPGDARYAGLLEQLDSYARAGRVDVPGDDLTSLFRRTDADRDWLSAALRAGPKRFVYVGHVTAAATERGQADDSQLHLSCSADTPGLAEPMREHRPLSARDLLADPQRWPMPERVALIGCDSGADARFRDPYGLVGAVVRAGATLVTGTRWPLLTEHALSSLADVAGNPITDAVLAVDAAHDAPDAVAAFSAWQRERLAAWRSSRTVADSPLLWAGLVTFTTA